MQTTFRGSVYKRGVATLAVFGLVTTACGSSSHNSSSTSTNGASIQSGDSVGITSTTITLGQLADVSGPVPGLFSGAQEGLAAWAAYVNSTGGLNGRKVVIDFKDSALSCPAYTNGINQLVGSVFALVGTFSLLDSCGIKALTANPGLLDLEAQILNPAVYPIPNAYAPTPAPPGVATTIYQYVKDTYGAAAVTKTAALWGTTEKYAFDEQEAAAQSVGYKFVYNRGFSPFETNFTSDILRMKAAGVEIVDATDTPAGTDVDFLEQAQQQNFHPLAVIASSAYDSSFFKLLPSSINTSNVIDYSSTVLYLGEDAATVPEIGTLTSWVQKVHPGAALNLFAVDAWSSGLLFQDAMSKLGKNPTRSQILAAMKGITSFDADGLISTSDPGQKKGGVCYVMIGTKGRTYERIYPKNKGFECKGVYHSSAQSS